MSWIRLSSWSNRKNTEILNHWRWLDDAGAVYHRLLHVDPLNQTRAIYKPSNFESKPTQAIDLDQFLPEQKLPSLEGTWTNCSRVDLPCCVAETSSANGTYSRSKSSLLSLLMRSSEGSTSIWTRIKMENKSFCSS